ncbi:hypothetical protein M426DRAFT_225372 [Hypoxylon sp. CI-4A]|nr:hypothetical protein M426DRAFT_225372 [Hypoxylon sp. CI-4A]
MALTFGALHLTSVGIPGPREGNAPTMYDNAAFVITHVKSLADVGKGVTLLTHSYGGIHGTQSVQGLSKKVRVIVSRDLGTCSPGSGVWTWP